MSKGKDVREKELTQNIAERIKQIREKLGYSQREFAKLLGIESGSYVGYEYGRRRPPFILLDAISKQFNVNLNWLISGEGPMFLNEQNVIQIQEDELIQLPYHKDSYVSAGYGFDNNSNNYEDTRPVLFSRYFLNVAFGITLKNGLHLVRVYGNSMEPTIPENSLVLVVDFQVEGVLRAGAVYVVKYNGEEFIKRVFKDPINKRLKLISDNPDYPPIEVSGEDSDRFKILGRVVGYIAGV